MEEILKAVVSEAEADDSTHVTGGTAAVDEANSDDSRVETDPDSDLIKETDPDSVRMRINKLRDRMAEKENEIQELKSRLESKERAAFDNREELIIKNETPGSLLEGLPRDSEGNVFYKEQWMHPDYAEMEIRYEQRVERLEKRLGEFELKQRMEEAEEARTKVLNDLNEAITKSMAGLPQMDAEQRQMVHDLISSTAGKMALEVGDGQFDPLVAKKLIPEAAKKVRSALGYFGNQQLKSNATSKDGMAAAEPPGGGITMEGKKSIWEMSDAERDKYVSELGMRIIQD